VAHLLNKELGLSSEEGVRRVLVETREGNSGDVRSPSVPLVVQCKVGERPPIYDAVTEAVEASYRDEVPVAIIKRNADGPRPKVELAVFRLEDAIWLFREVWGR